MKRKYLSNFTVELPSKLSTILKKINQNESGLIFVVDKNFTLKGSISDGDIRRNILKKKKIKEIIFFKSSIVNKTPIFLKSNSKIETILQILNHERKSKNIRCLPLVDSKKRVVDISTTKKIRRYPLASPILGEQELNNAINSIKSGWISSRGAYIPKFEKNFEKYLKGGHAVAVSNGTVALQVALSSLGIKKNDEVIVPNFTFGASINAIINVGAKPVIADVSLKNWTLDIKDLEKKISNKTKAIMPVHIYGQPCQIDEIVKIAKKNKLLIVEDSAEAIGATYKKRLIGLDGDCSCFSFFANKTITTGEGGMAVFKKKNIAQKARILINQGLSSKRKYYHDFVGSNYRLTNLQAGIGVAQLDRIDELLKMRKKIFKMYDQSLMQIKSIKLLPKNNWSTNSYWLYTLVVKNLGRLKRDKLIDNLQDLGIECRPGFFCLSEMKPFKKFAYGKFPNSKFLSENSISLPTTNINSTDQKFIIQKLIKEINK